MHKSRSLALRCRFKLFEETFLYPRSVFPLFSPSMKIQKTLEIMQETYKAWPLWRNSNVHWSFRSTEEKTRTSDCDGNLAAVEDLYSFFRQWSWQNQKRRRDFRDACDVAEEERKLSPILFLLLLLLLLLRLFPQSSPALIKLICSPQKSTRWIAIACKVVLLVHRSMRWFKFYSHIEEAAPL